MPVVRSLVPRKEVLRPVLSQAIAASRAGDGSVRRLAAGERRTHASQQGQPEDNDLHRIPAPSSTGAEQ
jgi:hypothetical protein